MLCLTVGHLFCHAWDDWGGTAKELHNLLESRGGSRSGLSIAEEPLANVAASGRPQGNGMSTRWGGGMNSWHLHLLAGSGACQPLHNAPPLRYFCRTPSEGAPRSRGRWAPCDLRDVPRPPYHRSCALVVLYSERLAGHSQWRRDDGDCVPQLQP